MEHHFPLRFVIHYKDYIELYEQKTKKFKRFPIVDAYKPDLDDFIVGKDDEEWLFASRRGGKPITRIQAYRILQDACFEAGITARIGTHTLRKTFGYHFYQEHKDIGLLQYLFNHSSQRVTLLYIGITQELIDSKLRSFVTIVTIPPKTLKFFSNYADITTKVICNKISKVLPIM